MSTLPLSPVPLTLFFALSLMLSCALFPALLLSLYPCVSLLTQWWSVGPRKVSSGGNWKWILSDGAAQITLNQMVLEKAPTDLALCSPSSPFFQSSSPPLFSSLLLTSPLFYSLLSPPLFSCPPSPPPPPPPPLPPSLLFPSGHVRCILFSLSPFLSLLILPSLPLPGLAPVPPVE